MSNIVPGCECIIINSPNHNGKQVTVVRSLNSDEYVLGEGSYKNHWFIKGRNLPIIPDWAFGHVARKDQLMRIDDFQPEESEIKRKELVK